MPGGEGKIVGAGNQQLYCRVDVTGADAGHKGLQNQITAYYLQGEGHRQGGSCLSRFRVNQQYQGQNNPNHSAIPQVRDKRHHNVANPAAQVGLDEVQHGKFPF